MTSLCKIQSVVQSIMCWRKRGSSSVLEERSKASKEPYLLSPTLPEIRDSAACILLFRLFALLKALHLQGLIWLSFIRAACLRAPSVTNVN